MRIENVEIWRFSIPFNSVFKHARAERACSDTIIIIVSTDSGVRGYGEVLARSYVTGETNQQVFTVTAPELAECIIGKQFSSFSDLKEFYSEFLISERFSPAVYGGFELAILNALFQRNNLNVEGILGRPRGRETGACLTLGLEVPKERIRFFVMQARMTGATVVKVKVGTKNDIERVALINEMLKGEMPIRLDANGDISLERAIELLTEGFPIQSLEQPFASDDPDLEAKLVELYARTNVPIMADESLCRVAEAEAWAKSKAYQVFNIRIGKCGGLLAASQIKQIALRSQIDIVAGTMVGESGVLNSASELFLAHSEELDYVEGLGQNRSFLKVDPVDMRSVGDGGHIKTFDLSPQAIREFTIGKNLIS